MAADDLISVFECPDPECRCRVLKQVVHCPVVRPVAFIEKKDDVKFSNEECCPDDIIWLMDENWDDDPKSPDYFYCAQCAKEWPSMFEGEDSVKASGALKQIPRSQYGEWLATEYEHNHDYSWELRESNSTHRFLCVLYRDGEVFGMCETWSPQIAGQWWFQLGDLYPNPEVFAWEEDPEMEDPDVWDDFLNDKYSNDNSKVIVRNNQYYDGVGLLGDSVHWEYTKAYATTSPDKKFNFEVTKVPDWAICYLVNGDPSGLTDDEFKLAKDFDSRYEVTSCGPDTELDTCPWTGLLSDLREVICLPREKS